MAFIVNNIDFYGNLGRYSWKTGVYLHFTPKRNQGPFYPFHPQIIDIKLQRIFLKILQQLRRLSQDVKIKMKWERSWYIEL